MPIYEYQCKHCGERFEEWLKVSEADNTQECPKCKQQAERLVSQTSFVLKGSGWYVTEYGKNSASSTPTAHARENTSHLAQHETEKQSTTTEESKNKQADSTTAEKKSETTNEAKTTSTSSTTSTEKTSSTKTATTSVA